MSSHVRPTELARLRFSRRWFLATGAASLAVPFPVRRAHAQASATHTFTQGEVEVIVLSDGTLMLPASFLAPTAPEEELEAILVEQYGSVPETQAVPANVTLLRSGGDLVLLDTGSGPNFQPSAGKLVENLTANGIDPAAVTKVVFTHAHPDHAWGTAGADGGLIFPNAAYYIGGTEWDFWTNPDVFAQLPPDLHDLTRVTQAQLAAVKDRATMLKDGDSIAPGITALDSPGHTPGHMSVFVEGGEGLIVIGDVAVNEFVSFPHPDWPHAFDAIPDLANATRRATFERAVADRSRLLGFHFTYPGIGFVEAVEGGEYRFVPEA